MKTISQLEEAICTLEQQNKYLKEERLHDLHLLHNKELKINELTL